MRNNKYKIIKLTKDIFLISGKNFDIAMEIDKVIKQIIFKYELNKYVDICIPMNNDYLICRYNTKSTHKAFLIDKNNRYKSIIKKTHTN